MYKYCVNIFKTVRKFFAVQIFLQTLNGKVFFFSFFYFIFAIES